MALYLCSNWVRREKSKILLKKWEQKKEKQESLKQP